MKKAISITLITLIVFATLTMVTFAVAQTPTQPTITTNKADYSPNEQVTIYGSGFSANANIKVEVTAPDPTGNAVLFATSDSKGNFVTNYGQPPPLVEGIYTVVATEQANPTITATTTFTDKVPKNIYVSATSGGKVTYSPQGTGIGTVESGTSAHFTIPSGSHISFTAISQPGYTFAGWSGDGPSVNTNPISKEVGNDIGSNSHPLTATFAINTYTITPTVADGHGTISPSTIQTVNYGQNSPTFTITPAEGYHVANVVDGTTDLGAITSYMFTNVQANHAISASFTIDIPTVLTIGVYPAIVNKYDSPHATVSGTLKSEGTSLNGYIVTISYNDGRSGQWVECGHPTTGLNGYYSVDFPVTPDFANGFVAFEAKFAGDTGSGYAAAPPAYTGAIGKESGNLSVLPEYLFGGLAAFGACFVGFVFFKKRSSLPHLHFR